MWNLLQYTYSFLFNIIQVHFQLTFFNYSCNFSYICIDYLGDSEIAAKVISESEQEGEEARNFLDDVRVTFPQVCRR